MPEFVWLQDRHIIVESVLKGGVGIDKNVIIVKTCNDE